MRQEWISARADKYHTEGADWREAYAKAYADATTEWPLYREPQYEESEDQYRNGMTLTDWYGQ